MPAAHDPLRPSSFALDGKVVVVTGAAQGIGEAIAFAARRAGARVALCDRNSDGLADLAARVRRVDAGLTTQPVARPPSEPHIDLTEPKVVPDPPVADDDAVSTGVLDVRDAEAVATFMRHTVARHGQVDVLVNNAGGGFLAPFATITDKGEDALVRENFSSVVACTRAALDHFPAPAAASPTAGEHGRGGGGSVINITSIEAHRAGPGYAIYSAMKAAVANLTCTLALELGDRHIRVNCIAPDVIPTPGIGMDMPVPNALPYAGHVDDVAAAFLFLAADVSAFVTGTTIHVDGGNHAAGGWHRGRDGSFTTNP